MAHLIKYALICLPLFWSNVYAGSFSQPVWHYPKYSFGKKHTGSEWPFGVVKYKFDQSLSTTTIQLIRSVFQEIQQKTCVQFEEIHVIHRDQYVEFKEVEWESDLFQCYFAEPCLPKEQNSDFKKYWRRNRVIFSTDCEITRSMVAHALCHVLCLVHQYEISDSMETGHLTELGLMDVELINKVYRCEGCHRHQWREVNIFTEFGARNLYNFGFYDQNKRRIFPCRGFVNGTGALGSFMMELGVCQVYCNGKFHNLTENAQILTIPNGITTCMEKLNSKVRTLYQYEVVNSFGLTTENITEMGIPALESNTDQNFSLGYVAFATLSGNWGGLTLLDNIGTAYINESGEFQANFRIDDTVVESSIFKILVCKEMKVETK